MNDEHPYRDLNLDEILQITASDAAHAPQLREQGKGLKALAEKLDHSVEAMLVARATAETGFEGLTASQLHHRATRLVARGSEGHAALRDQPGVFFALSDQAELTHQRMLELRGERDARLDQAAPEDRAGIRDNYNVQARDYMRETTAGYVKSLRRSDWMKGYNGPRVARDGEVDGPKGFRDHTTSGPSLRGTADGGGAPQLQSTLVATEVGGGTSSGGGHVLRQDSWAGYASAGFKNKNAKKNKDDKKERDKEDFGGPVKRDVLPPVIGSRPEPEMAAAEPPAPAPRSDGTVSPVFGARDGVPGTEPGEPGPRNDGLLPPVLGARPPMMGMGTGVMPGGSAPVVPPPARGGFEPVPHRRSFVAPSAGVRSSEPRLQHPVVGRVFGAEPVQTGSAGADRAETPVVPPQYSRAPKPVHGGPDSLNRAVVRNSRAFAAPPPTDWPAREAARPPRWSRAPEEPEYETGPFITNYNLGRSQ